MKCSIRCKAPVILLPIGLSIFILAILCSATAVPARTVVTTRFGEVEIIAADKREKFALYFQPRERTAADGAMIEALTAAGFVVARVQAESYLEQLSDELDDCLFLAGEIDRLAQLIEKEALMDSFTPPLLVGRGAGAALSAVAATQHPPSFAGLLLVDYCSQFPLPATFCDPGPQAKVGKSSSLIQLPELPLSQLRVRSTSSCNQEGTGAGDAAAKFAERSLSFDKEQLAASKELLIQLLRSSFAANNSATEVSAPSAELTGLPVIEPENIAALNKKRFVIFISGDGGWAAIDRAIADELSERGETVIGFDALKYFWWEKSPSRAAADLTRIVDHYTGKWRGSHAVIAGFSLGADVIPSMVNRLPESTLKTVEAVVLLSPGTNVEFEVHMKDWIPGASDNEGDPILPEVDQLKPRTLCVYGSEEESVCRAARKGNIEVAEFAGSHHFDEEYGPVAKRILDFLARGKPAEAQK